MSSLALHPSAASSAAAPGLAEAPHLPALDGLRGLAILLVMPHNLMVHTQPDGWWSHLMLAWVERGWTGVQLFFALSGFLITSILLDTAHCAHRLRVFYARRALRIFPLYYGALVVVLVAVPALQTFLQMSLQTTLHGPSAPLRDGGMLWASYWVFLSNWFTPYSPLPSLPHFWSLAVEEQFYLVWPLLLWRLSPRQVMRLGLALALLSAAVRIAMVALGESPEVVYESTLSRMEPLVLGGAAAAALREPACAAWLARHRRGVGAAAGAALLLTALTTHLHALGAWQQTLGYAGLSVACVLAVAWAALGDQAGPRRAGGAVRWLHAGWLRRAGRYSYGMYVVHVPLALLLGRPLLAHLGYDVLGPAGGRALGPVGLVVYLLLGMLASYLLALASYHAVEKRCLRLKPAYPAVPA